MPYTHRKPKQPGLEVELKSTLTVEEVQKLSPAEQADTAYILLGRITDMLADMGFDPGVIAHVAYDLGQDLYQREGGPVQIIRVDPRPGEPHYVVLVRKR
jgi:hypothetical protein